MYQYPYFFVAWYNVIWLETKPGTIPRRKIEFNAKILEDKVREKFAESNYVRWLGKCLGAVRNLVHTVTQF